MESPQSPRRGSWIVSAGGIVRVVEFSLAVFQPPEIVQDPVAEELSEQVLSGPSVSEHGSPP